MQRTLSGHYSSSQAPDTSTEQHQPNGLAGAILSLLPLAPPPDFHGTSIGEPMTTLPLRGSPAGPFPSNGGDTATQRTSLIVEGEEGFERASKAPRWGSMVLTTTSGGTEAADRLEDPTMPSLEPANGNNAVVVMDSTGTRETYPTMANSTSLKLPATALESPTANTPPAASTTPPVSGVIFSLLYSMCANDTTRRRVQEGLSIVAAALDIRDGSVLQQLLHHLSAFPVGISATSNSSNLHTATANQPQEDPFKCPSFSTAPAAIELSPSQCVNSSVVTEASMSSLTMTLQEMQQQLNIFWVETEKRVRIGTFSFGTINTESPPLQPTLGGTLSKVVPSPPMKPAQAASASPVVMPVSPSKGGAVEPLPKPTEIEVPDIQLSRQSTPGNSWRKDAFLQDSVRQKSLEARPFGSHNSITSKMTATMSSNSSVLGAPVESATKKLLMKLKKPRRVSSMPEMSPVKETKENEAGAFTKSQSLGVSVRRSIGGGNGGGDEDSAGGGGGSRRPSLISSVFTEDLPPVVETIRRGSTESTASRMNHANTANFQLEDTLTSSVRRMSIRRQFSAVSVVASQPSVHDERSQHDSPSLKRPGSSSRSSRVLGASNSGMGDSPGAGSAAATAATTTNAHSADFGRMEDMDDEWESFPSAQASAASPQMTAAMRKLSSVRFVASSSTMSKSQGSVGLGSRQDPKNTSKSNIHGDRMSMESFTPGDRSGIISMPSNSIQEVTSEPMSRADEDSRGEISGEMMPLFRRISGPVMAPQQGGPAASMGSMISSIRSTDRWAESDGADGHSYHGLSPRPRGSMSSRHQSTQSMKGGLGVRLQNQLAKIGRITSMRPTVSGSTSAETTTPVESLGGVSKLRRVGSSPTLDEDHPMVDADLLGDDIVHFNSNGNNQYDTNQNTFNNNNENDVEFGDYDATALVRLHTMPSSPRRQDIPMVHAAAAVSQPLEGQPHGMESRERGGSGSLQERTSLVPHSPKSHQDAIAVVAAIWDHPVTCDADMMGLLDVISDEGIGRPGMAGGAGGHPDVNSGSLGDIFAPGTPPHAALSTDRSALLQFDEEQKAAIRHVNAAMAVNLDYLPTGPLELAATLQQDVFLTVDQRFHVKFAVVMQQVRFIYALWTVIYTAFSTTAILARLVTTQSGYPEWVAGVECALDVIYFLFTLVFTTMMPYEERGQIVTDWRLILGRSLRQPMVWLPSAIVCFPMLIVLLPLGYGQLAWSRVNVMLRYVRFNSFLEVLWERYPGVHPNFVRLVHTASNLYLLITMFVVVLIGLEQAGTQSAFFYNVLNVDLQVPIPSPLQQPSQPVSTVGTHLRKWSGLSAAAHTGMMKVDVISASDGVWGSYVWFEVLTGIAERAVPYPEAESQVIISFARLFFSIIAYAIIVTSVEEMVVHVLVFGDILSDKLESALSTMEELELPEELRDEVITYYRRMWDLCKSFDGGGNASDVMQDFPDELRGEIEFEFNARVIRSIPLFAKLAQNVEFVRLLAGQLNYIVVTPGCPIVEKGEEGDCMYFLTSGDAAVIGDDENDRIATLSQGSFFGETTMLFGGTRPHTIIAVTLCVCYVVMDSQFDDIVDEFPEALEDILAAAVAQLKKQKAGALDVPGMDAVGGDLTVPEVLAATMSHGNATVTSGGNNSGFFTGNNEDGDDVAATDDEMAMMMAQRLKFKPRRRNSIAEM